MRGRRLPGGQAVQSARAGESLKPHYFQNAEHSGRSEGQAAGCSWLHCLVACGCIMREKELQSVGRSGRFTITRDKMSRARVLHVRQIWVVANSWGSVG